MEKYGMKMFNSSSEVEDLTSYRCPKCTRSFGALHNLRDHLDIVHLYKPTRDTDDETYQKPETILSSFSKDRQMHPIGLHTNGAQDTLEIERKLRLAKELELRHKILHRHTKSEDELKALNEEILNAKQRQYEMCTVIHNAKQEVDNLRLSAEKVTAEQQQIINRLRDELQLKDNQLEKASNDLHALADNRQGLLGDVQTLGYEREKHRHRLEEICVELERKDRVTQDKQREIESLQAFIKQASQKEMAARQKLEQFINNLLDRAEKAEDQVRKLKKQLSLQGMQKSVSDNHLHQPADLTPGGYRQQAVRSHSADPMMSMPYHRSQDGISMVPSSPHPRPQSQPQYMYATPAENSPRHYNTQPSRKLPAGPFPNGYDHEYFAYPVQAPDNMVASVSQNYGKPLKSKRDQVEGRKGASRYDNERPESGYGSVHPGNSRPQSRLSSVSEHSNASTDTVVPAYEVEQEHSRVRSSPYGSRGSGLDVDNEVSELSLAQDLPLDDQGIIWEDEGYEPIPSSSKSSTLKPKPKLNKKLSSDSKKSWTPTKKNVPSPLEFSRMSSINSLEKDILTDINDQTKFEMQRYKFLLRDKLHMLKEQEKYLEKDEDIWSDSDLTSVTSDDSLTSLTFTSFSEVSDDEGVGRKWKKSKSKLPLTRTGKVKRLVAEKPKPIGVVPQTAMKPVSLTPPAGLKANRLSVSRPSAFHSPSPATTDETSPDTATLQRHSLLFLIFNYLDTSSLVRVSTICREWREISRHPALWRKVILTKRMIASKFLQTLSQWCCAIQSLTLEGLRARPKKSYETVEEYKRKTRGLLEDGLDALLKASQHSLVSIRIVDCGHILTDRCLWLASCYCHQLQRVTYVSNTDPLGSEVIWSLGAGCRDINTLIVPPLYPNEKGDRFTNRCVQMISWCWPELKSLSVGGDHVGKKGLVEIARNCKHLRKLELHQMKDLKDEVVIAMCQDGLRYLHTLDIVYTRIAPSAVQIFIDSCPRLMSMKVRLGITDYYNDVENHDNRMAFGKIVRDLEILKKSSAVAKVLTVQADYK